MNSMAAVSRRTARVAADDIARRLDIPSVGSSSPWRAQSLAYGAAGIAMLHVERALAGVAGWDVAHAWLVAASQAPVSAGADASVFFGLPALAFALSTAADGSANYARTRAAVDAAVVALTDRRLREANARIDRGDCPRLDEFDAIYGLTGIGAYLLKRLPDSDVVVRVLQYLVRLTEPVAVDGEALVGWWVRHDPHFKSSATFAGGHGNLGTAHGAAGPLTLLALALRQGVEVVGHRLAIARLNAWFDAWRQDGVAGPWWPQWISRRELHTGRVDQHGPGRPSWCYGTPGIARALQVAAAAVGDKPRQEDAEKALASCVVDPVQLARVSDAGLCHGWAGLVQLLGRAAADATTPALANRYTEVAERFLQHHQVEEQEDSGFLEGEAGSALVLHGLARGTQPLSEWDTCLLLG